MPLKRVYIRKWLLPVSWLYGFVIYIRNKMFDWGGLEQKKYKETIISIGNLTVGGTGKTPHSEYLIGLLKDKYRVAILSRGYKRKTKGYVLATADSSADQIGDEPSQIKNKFPEITVAVDSDRRNGIEQLLSLTENKRPQVILLDDAYQHRYVSPSFSILLTDFNRLMSRDKLLPAGRLREPLHNSDRANMVIITKCPLDLTPLDQRIVAKDLNLYPYQDLYFTSFDYGNLTPVFPENAPELNCLSLDKYDVLIVTGIVNPTLLYKKIKEYCWHFETMQYPDHHMFGKNDILKIEQKFKKIDNEHKVIIVTEKDASRLRCNNLITDDLKASLYYLPIEVVFINKEEQKTFNNKILEHVRKNK